MGDARMSFMWSAGVLRSGIIGGLVLAFAGCTTSPPPPPAPAASPSPYAELASVKAFGRVQATLEEMKQVVLQDAETEREASEGMRAILRTLAMSIDTAGDQNPKAPHFARMDTKIRKVGGDNPDAEYDNVHLDNRWDYVIRGNLGTVRHLSFTISGAIQPDGRRARLAYFNERTLGADERGDFEIHLTKADDGGPNWVDTSNGVTSILVRQYIGDREAEALATYDIEVVGRVPYEDLPPSTDREIAKALMEASYSLGFMFTMHRTIGPELWDTPNTFSRFNSDSFGEDISSADNLYMFGTYQIEEDEALVIETDPLDVRYWNLAIESRWHETVDYLTRRTHLSLDHAVVDADGKLRFVVAHGQTPHPNWIETGGHREGWMTFRWVGERDSEVSMPTVLRVKREDVPKVLAGRRTGGS
ncbi:MAG: hypothetical protein CL931_16985 [Deltaproteobacteria bacterium]|nr:hypothetical protein [Deltaproteobacteria bacterium]